MARNNRGEMPPLPEVAVEKEEVIESVDMMMPPVHAPLVSAAPQEPIPPAPPAKAKPIEVYATRDGFYGGERKSPKNVNRDGSPKCFTIRNMGELGSWMKLADPVLQAKREADDKKKAAEGKKLSFSDKFKAGR